MKKITLYAFLLIDVVLLVFSFIQLNLENNNSSTGLAALSSVGNWVIYCFILVLSIIVLLILFVLIFLKYR